MMIRYTPLLCVLGVILAGCKFDIQNFSFEIPAEVASISATLASSPIPQPHILQVQLTQGGCCVQPFFSADGNTVLFIDKPSDQIPVGIYGVDLTTFVSPETSPPQLIDERIGFRSSDQSIIAYPDADNISLMRFVNTVSKESWTIDTLGNWPVFSPDGRHIYWNATDRQGPYDERPTDVWVAQIDGSEARIVLTVYGGGANGWFPDNERLLIIGRDEPIGELETMMVYSLEDRTRLALAQEKQLRGGSISPDGSWIIYLTTFSGDPNKDGVRAVRDDNSQRRNLPFFGPHYWLNDQELIFIPTRQSTQDGFALWRLNMGTGTVTRLTDPTKLPLNIEGGDWVVSPDGKRVVYVSAVDRNLYLIELP